MILQRSLSTGAFCPRVRSSTALWAIALALAAGCIEPAGPSPSPSESSPAVFSIGVDYEGSVGRQVCLPGAATACGRVIREENVNTEYVVDGSANATRVAGVLYWNSTQAATDELRVRIMAERTACRNCYETVAAIISASPLTFDVSVAMTEPVEVFEVWVDVPPDQAGPAVYSVHEGDAFHVVARLSG